MFDASANDFTSDAAADLIWQHEELGTVAAFEMMAISDYERPADPADRGRYDVRRAKAERVQFLVSSLSPAFKVVGTGDFNRDQHGDLVLLFDGSLSIVSSGCG